MKQNFAVMIMTMSKSWWVIGVIGWIIVYMNYPVDSILPLYAE